MRIDSLNKFHELRAAGYPEDQANILARSFADASELEADVIMKPEFQIILGSIEDQIQNMGNRLEKDIKNISIVLEKEITHVSHVMYLFGSIIVATIIVDIVKGFFIH
jgi:hypothetical protein